MKTLRLILRLCLVAIAGSTSLPTLASDPSEPILVGVYQNPPKIALNQQGEAQGFWPDLLDAVATAENWNIQYVPCYWNRCLQLVEQGKLDLMLDVAFTPEREQRFDFNQEAVLSSWSVVYVKLGNTLHSILDLDQKRVAVLSDSIQQEVMAQQAYAFDADQDSAYYQALNRWLAPPSPTLWTKVRPLLPVLLLLGGGTGLVISLLWNKSLRQEIQQRRHVEDQLQRLADNTPGVIFRLQLNADGTKQLLYVSPGALNLWDLAPEELMQNPNRLSPLIPPEDSDRLWQSLHHSAQTLAPWTDEWPMTTPSGRQVWMQLAAKPQPLPQGDIIWDGLVLDITARKQQEADRQQIETSLRQSETTLRQILKAIPDLLLWTRPDGICVGMSAGQDLENLMTDEANIGSNQYDLLPPELVAQRQEAVAQALATGRVQIYEQELRTDDFHQYEEVRVVPVEPDLLLVIVRDISDRKRREVERIQNEAYRQQAEQALRDSERRYRQVVEAQTDFILRSRPDTTITFANEALCRVLGKQPEEVIGKRWQDLAHPDDLEKDAFKSLARLTPDRPRFFAENRDRRANGHLGWTQWLNQGIFDAQGNLVEIQSVGRDVTDLKLAEQAARESESRYRLVAENISDLVCLNDLEGRYTYVSPSCKTFLGYDPEELIGHTPYEFIHPEDRARVRREVEKPAAQGQTPQPLINRARKKSGDYIWVETLVKPILDPSGQVTQFQTTARDVTDRIQVENQLRHAALHDALTGLPNRSVLMARLEEVIVCHQSQDQYQSALLFLDLDQFKVINDSLGHLTGDRLLVWVADKLSQVVRTTDIVARISGDEFVVLLENLDHPSQATCIAERLLEDLKEPFLMDQREIFITTSIGIVLDFSPYQSAEDLVRDADIAMYQAKASGRANFAIFDPQMRIQVVERMNLSNDLRRALEYQELLLYYQPIVALEQLTIEGFEVLLRWQHPKLGMISPAQFIPLAEETGLIVSIGNWLLRTACQQLATWRHQLATAQKLKISLNLSVRQLQSDTLLDQFNQVLQSTGIPPEALTLEITESLLVQNFEATHQLLAEVQARGIHISIDDFGTGYSSLSYLHRLPVDALKIDQAFVSYMGQDAKNQTIAESIIALSNVLGLDAIAEGIETVDQLQWLQTHGCEYGQGYLFSRPIPADAVVPLLETDLKGLITSHHRRLPIAEAGQVPPIGPVADNGPNQGGQ